MSQKKPKSPHWYQTLPGLMTAFAAIITASTGLLVALNQAGLIGSQSQSSNQSRSNRPVISAATEIPNPPPTFTRVVADAPTTTPAPPAADIASATVAPVAATEPTATAPAPGGAAEYPVTLISGGEATAGDATYRIMAAQIEQPSEDRLVLNIALRVINNGPSSENFWDRSARLIIDDVPTAPIEAPNEIVEPDDSNQAPFLFDIPSGVSTVNLQVGQVGQETARIPIDLTAAQPPPTPTAPPSGGTLQYPVTLAAGGEATAGDSVYRIMAAQIERPNDEQLVLNITLRVINNGPSSDNFWDRSARLLIDGIPHAPFEAPNEIVDAQDSKQAVFLFEIPANLTSVILQVGRVGQETAKIPLDLTATQQP